MRGARLELARPLGAVDCESILEGKDPTPRAKSHIRSITYGLCGYSWCFLFYVDLVNRGTKTAQIFYLVGRGYMALEASQKKPSVFDRRDRFDEVVKEDSLTLWDYSQSALLTALLRKAYPHPKSQAQVLATF